MLKTARRPRPPPVPYSRVRGRRSRRPLLLHPETLCRRTRPRPANPDSARPLIPHRRAASSPRERTARAAPRIVVKRRSTPRAAARCDPRPGATRATFLTSAPTLMLRRRSASAGTARSSPGTTSAAGRAAPCSVGRRRSPALERVVGRLFLPAASLCARCSYEAYSSSGSACRLALREGCSGWRRTAALAQRLTVRQRGCPRLRTMHFERAEQSKA